MKKYLVLLFLLIPSLCFGVDAASIMGKSADPSGTNNVDKVNGLTWGTASGNATKINGVNCAAAAGGCTISDDYSSDTSANYYAIRGSGRGVAVSGGALWPENVNYDGHQYHTTNINNNDHYVQADILLTDADDRGGLVARCNGNTTSATGYAFAPATNSVQFYRFAGATQTYIGAFTVSWTNGQTHTLRIRVTGSDFYVWVDGVASSSNPITDTTYSSGTYVGTRFESNGTSGSVDNFKADTATTCMN